jgi:nitrite reductase (NADH) large subunit
MRTWLDARMAAAVGAHRDPWKEGLEPVVPGQFRTALPLRSLPLVPVRAGNGAVTGPVPAVGSAVAGPSNGGAA